jgi:hypothetical protein
LEFEDARRGQEIACPSCGKITLLIEEVPTERNVGTGIRSVRAGNNNLIGCLGLIGGIALLAVVIASCNEVLGNTWLMRNTTLRDERVRQIEEGRRQTVEGIKNDRDHIGLVLDEELSNYVAQWDNETPAQRHQDAVQEEWEEYKRDKAAYDQTLYDVTHEDKVKSDADKEVDKFLQGKE